MADRMPAVSLYAAGENSRLVPLSLDRLSALGASVAGLSLDTSQAPKPRVVDCMHNCAYSVDRWPTMAWDPQNNGARTRAVRSKAMKAQYDFTGGKRGPVLKTPAGKTRITIRIDDDLLQ